MRHTANGKTKPATPTIMNTERNLIQNQKYDQMISTLITSVQMVAQTRKSSQNIISVLNYGWNVTEAARTVQQTLTLPIVSNKQEDGMLYH